jgi:cytochrome c oxidase assembly protein subunit 15
MTSSQRHFITLARLGTLLALIVVVLGAWVRLTDAGLGCPDWPGCYGRLVVPSEIAPSDLDPEHASRPLESGKAWREMIHRYAASTLGLLALVLAGLAWRNRRLPGQPLAAPLALVALVVFQGLLGMWTVTLLLKPLVVVAHLLGGFATMSLFFWLGRWRELFAPRGAGSGARSGVGSSVGRLVSRLRTLGVAAAGVLVVQIALGGWTSANYAALACPDFPTCQTQWWPEIADFADGFVLWRGLGIDYEGGVLDHPARVAVHFAHRLGAVAAAFLLALLALRLTATPGARPDGLAVLGALAAQLTLGVSIVLFGVPLPVAVAHNGMAAILLLTVINANQRIRQS